MIRIGKKESKKAGALKVAEAAMTVRSSTEVLDWPGNSPDVNPIENLCSIVTRRVSKMGCSTKKKSIENVVKVWFRDDDIKNVCPKLGNPCRKV
ncbi:uncharacterized protein CEXT_245611 [Caerostris extrusa]|uniref:Tc1-like transposase DDE domain-containing protein n=1 Tax=Caerostris extrusa TaxID=172846 RepID=A0AAV4N6J4_CAEEX|nr:uncharacterized protein CEXT_245611 [Caerostris extrusa]